MAVPVGAYAGPSCWDKLRLGFFTGACAGTVSGTLYAGIVVYRYGLRGREILKIVSKYMMQGGATFGALMALRQSFRC